MIFTRLSLVLLAESESIKQEIDPSIVCAVVDIFSSWDPALIMPSTEAFNPGLSYSSQEEANLQRSYLGLCQFSGQQAREIGYKQNSEGLLAPEINLECGIKILNTALAQTGRLDRALTVVYGYRVNGIMRRIFAKIPNYLEFLSSPQRPANLTGVS